MCISLIKLSVNVPRHNLLFTFDYPFLLQAIYGSPLIENVVVIPGGIYLEKIAGQALFSSDMCFYN